MKYLKHVATTGVTNGNALALGLVALHNLPGYRPGLHRSL